MHMPFVFGILGYFNLATTFIQLLCGRRMLTQKWLTNKATFVVRRLIDKRSYF